MPSETAAQDFTHTPDAPGGKERFLLRMRETFAALREEEAAREARRQAAARESEARLAPFRHELALEELRRMGAPLKVREEHTLGLIDESAAPVRAAARFLQRPELTFLVLHGGSGTGKTTAACLAASRVPHSFVLEVPLLEMTRTYSEEMERMLHRARTCSLLVLNEMGTGPRDASGYALQKIDYLVDARYARKAKCIITTNLTEADFLSRYEKRVEDRMREVGVFFNCGDTSLRQRSK